MGLNGSSYDYIIIPRASLITNFQPPLANSGTWGLVLEQRIDSVCSTCKEALVSGYFFVTCWNVCGLDQDYWSSKIVLDCLIILFWTSWSLDLEWFKGQIALVFLIRWFVQFGGHLDPLIDSRKGIVAWFLILALNTHSPTANSWSSWTSRSLWTRTPTFG